MQLNIKNETTFRLAHELAQLTGENVTKAVTHALQARIDALHQQSHIERQGLANRMSNVAANFAALPDIDERFVDEILYDADGLPRDSCE